MRTPTGEVIVERLPGGVVVIDALGTVLAVNAQAAALVGRDVDDLVGRSVLEMVDPETSWAYAAATAMAADYPGVDMGPLRVTFLHADGTLRHADLWARNHLDDPDVGGIVCLVTPETAAVGLGVAVTAVAKRESAEDVARKVAMALRGHPVSGDAVVLAERDDALVVLAATAGPTVVAEVRTAADLDDEQPWHTVARTGTRALVEDLGRLDPPLSAAALGAGYTALWCEPVPRRDGDGLEVAGVLAVWRDHGGNPSPNELSTVFQAAAILSLGDIEAAPPV